MRHFKPKKTRLPRKVKKHLNLQGVKYSDYIKALDQREHIEWLIFKHTVLNVAVLPKTI